MNDFGYTVKKHLLDNGLKQQTISDNCELSKGAVSQLLNRDNITLDKMIMISDALNCDLEITLKPRESSNNILNTGSSKFVYPVKMVSNDNPPKTNKNHKC